MQDKLIENMSFAKAPFARNYSVEFLEVIVSEKEFKVKDCIQAISNNISSTKIQLFLLIINLASAIHQHCPSHATALKKAILNGNNNPKAAVQEAVSLFLAEHY